MCFENVCKQVCAVVWGDGFLIVPSKVYRRELEEGGVVVDPLKASYTVRVSQLWVRIVWPFCEGSCNAGGPCKCMQNRVQFKSRKLGEATL